MKEVSDPSRRSDFNEVVALLQPWPVSNPWLNGVEIPGDMYNYSLTGDFFGQSVHS